MEENEKEGMVPCQFMNRKGKMYFGMSIGKKIFIKKNKKWLELFKDSNRFYEKR